MSSRSRPSSLVALPAANPRCGHRWARLLPLGALATGTLLGGCAEVQAWTDGALGRAFGVVDEPTAAAAVPAPAPAPVPGRVAPADPPPAAPSAARPTTATKPTVPAIVLDEESPGSWPAPTDEQLSELETTLRLDPAAPRCRKKAERDPSAPDSSREGVATTTEDDLECEELDPAVARTAYTRPDDLLDPERVLVSIVKETMVHAGPSFDSRKIGYLRAGAVVRRADAPTGHRRCRGGWYRIEPTGYVCVGRTASLDASHAVAQATRVRPDREAPLPYRYSRGRYPGPPFYVRIPTADEQLATEQDMRGHRRRTKWWKAWDHVLVEPLPAFLAEGRSAPSLHGYVHSRKTLHTGRAIPDSGFALSHVFEHDGRKFGLSLDLNVLPLDRLEPVEPSEFAGVHLGAEHTLPLVFMHTHAGVLFEGDPTTGLRRKRTLGFREAVSITGKYVRLGGAKYLETKGGDWIRDRYVVRVDPMQKVPSWATPGRTWVDVSILRQTLVAYEGTTPVYATLVSTGAAGLDDPEKTLSTVRGRFLIHTKHVTATMSGDAEGDEFDLRDVPYVQYFTEGYALHAAYWHDQFGRPKSHGCINLSPLDARWLFEWTDPPVPEKWHGAMSLREGTLVSIHP